MWGKDAQRSRYFIEGSPFNSVTPIVYNLHSDIPIILAGRFVVLGNENQIQLIDIQHFFKGYSTAQHRQLLHYELSLEGMGFTSLYGSTPVFAEPYLYIAMGGAIQRIHVRMRKHETIIRNERISPQAPPASIISPKRTMLVFVFGKRFALLMTDRYHKSLPNESFELLWGQTETKGKWYPPIFWNNHWIFIDADGNIIAMRILDKPPFWEVNPNFPATMNENNTVRFSPPSLVNNNIFINYKSDEIVGVKQINLVTFQIKNHVIHNLDFYPDTPPMPFHHQGVFVSLDNGARATFIPTESATKINLDLENFNTFNMKQFIQIGNQSFIWVKDGEELYSSKLVAITPNFSGRKIIGRVIGKFPIDSSSIISFLYLPAKYYSKDCFLVQNRDKLIFIYST